MAMNKDLVTGLYVAIYDRAPDQAGRDGWLSALDAGTYNATTMAAAFIEAAPAKFSELYDGKTNEEVVQAAYNNILGRDGEDAGVANWTAFLDANGQDAFFATFVESALDYDSANDTTSDDATKAAAETAQQALSNKVEAGNYFADTLGSKSNGAIDSDIYNQSVSLLDGVTADAATVATAKATVDQLNVDTPDPGAGEGTTFTLTASTDRVDGTDQNDTFEAYLSQNQMIGGVSNTLSSADRLDGGAGVDTLNAELVDEFYGANGGNSIDVQPRTSNIENVTFEARDIEAAGSASNNSITVDAKNMTDIVEIGSRFSDGDLVIENLTTLTASGTARSTDSITVTMDHTDNRSSDSDASDLSVYFDEDYLVPTTNLGESSIVFKMMNQDAYDQNDGDNRLDGVYVARMEFTLDGASYDLAPYINENAQGLGDEFKTEAELVAHLNDVALPALAAANPSAATAINSLTFSIGGKWNDNNQNRIGDEIVLTASNAHTLETRDAWLTIDQAEQVDPGYASNRIERTGEQVGQDSEELAVNVELHKVGREGLGGDLIIGGESHDGAWDGEQYTGEGKGIDIFNISVLGNDKKPSNLGTIASTNGDLDIVNIKTDAAYVSGDTHASLTIRDGFYEVVNGTVVRQELDAVNANDFKGDLTIGSDMDVLNLNTLNAAGGGDVEFHADVTADGKYDYNTGAGNDTIDLDINTDATDRVDTALDVDTANGNDSVMLYTEVASATGSGHASQNTMELFKNMNASTAAGNDTIVIGGDGRYNIDAGANDDFVYVNSQTMTGTVSETDAAIAGTTGTWAFGRESDSVAKDFADKVLYQATLTVTFAGLESTVTVATDADGNFVADQVIINNAIEAAIEQNPELKQLLTVERGDGDQFMTVTSTVDGDNDLSVSVSQPNVVATNAATGEVEVGSGDVLDLVEGLMSTGVAGIDSNSDASNIATVMGAETVVVEAANNGGSSNATGASNVNYSVIDMGSGNNDLVVFDSNEASSNVLVVDQTFGKTTVLNFHDADGAVGEHAIDFTHYLSDEVDASANNNSLSAEAVNVTLNSNANGANFASNSVNMIVNLAENTADGETFASLTADNLLQALNGDEAYANIGESNPTATANLVGTVQNHVVMVENPNNAGEYKVFHLTSNLTANDATTGANGDADSDNADFATAVQLGTLDFGASINFNLVGNDTYTAERATLVNAADGDDTVVIPDATYAVSASAADVNEGQSVTFTLDTTGVDAGTSVAYSLTGVDAADLVDGSQLSGNFVVEADGSTDISIALAADAATEGAETMTISVAGQTENVTVNDTSTAGGNGGAKTDTSADVGTAAAAVTIDAATGALNFTDDASVETNVVIQNFTSDDQISVSNAAAGDYSFTSNGSDYVITFNNGGTLNTITLEGATGADGLVFDEASFEAAIGFDAFLLV